MGYCGLGWLYSGISRKGTELKEVEVYNQEMNERMIKAGKRGK